MSAFWGTAPAAAVLAVEVVCVALVAVRVTRALTAAEDALAIKVMVGLTLAIAQVCGIAILLGAVGQLQLLTVVVLHLLLATVALVAVRPRVDLPASHPIDPRTLAVVIACVVPASLALALGLAGGSTQSDTMHYHLVNAAHWLTTGSLATLAYAAPSWYTSTYPSNGEIFATWAMLPTHMDQLAYVTPLVFGLLAFIAVIAAVEELGGRPEIGALVALSLLATPLMWKNEVNGLETDLAGAAGLIAGLAFFLHARARPGLRWPVLAGLAIGLGLGSKYTATIPAIGMLAFGIAVVGARRWTSATLATGAALLTGGAWYLRNLLLTGDPVFPQTVALGPLRFFEGATGPLYEAARSLLRQAIHIDAGTITTWLWYLLIYVGPALVLVVAGLVAPVMHRGARRRTFLGISALGLFSTMVYIATPVSAGLGPPLQEGIGTFLIGSNIRYALPAMLVAVIAAAGSLPRFLTLGACVLGLAFDAYGIVGGPGFGDDTGFHLRTVVIAMALAVVGIISWMALRGLPGDVGARLRAWHQRWPGRLAGVAAGGMALWLVLATSMAVGAPKPRRSDVIDRAAELSRALSPTIAVIDVDDVGALLGPRLDRSFTAVGDGDAATQKSLTSASAFDARIVQLKPDIVVVTTSPWTIVSSRPQDWRPPASWSLVGTDSSENVYVTGPSH